VIRRHLQEIQYCYVSVGLPTNPNLGGMVKVTFVIGPDGRVTGAGIGSTTLGHDGTESCIVSAVRRWRFPRPEGQLPYVTYPFHFRPRSGPSGKPQPERRNPRLPAPRPDPRIVAPSPEPAPPPPPVNPTDVQAARAQTFVDLVAAGKPAEALDHAVRWREADPGDSLAYVVLGEVLRTQGDLQGAARAYGSVIDLYPSRADLRRFAGGRLERLGEIGLPLAVDTYRVAAAQRPDHPAGHHLHALALLLAGRPAEAFAALEAALDRSYHDRYLEAKRILAEDLEIVGAAWAAREPARRQDIAGRLAKRERRLSTTASLRFVLSWETDANDVDFHIHDGRGDHAFHAQRTLASGGQLYADVRNGYGPECFTIPGSTRTFPYRLEINYFSRGPMGYGMGKVDVIQHDGQGTVKHEVRPYIIYQDGQTIDLGKVLQPL
jgi:TonB family protein